MQVKLSSKKKLSYRMSPHSGDNAMYWGLLSHDKAGFQFRVNYKSLSDMAEHLAKVAPPDK